MKLHHTAFTFSLKDETTVTATICMKSKMVDQPFWHVQIGSRNFKMQCDRARQYVNPTTAKWVINQVLKKIKEQPGVINFSRSVEAKKL